MPVDRPGCPGRQFAPGAVIIEKTYSRYRIIFKFRFIVPINELIMDNV